MTFIGAFDPVIRNSKPNTYSTCIGEENENEMHLLSLYPGHLKY